MTGRAVARQTIDDSCQYKKGTLDLNQLGKGKSKQESLKLICRFN